MNSDFREAEKCLIIASDALDDFLDDIVYDSNAIGDLLDDIVYDSDALGDLYGDFVCDSDAKSKLLPYDSDTKSAYHFISCVTWKSNLNIQINEPI